MPEGIIDMADMETIFSVTDALGIHRESVKVELAKEDPGSVGRDANGNVEITVPCATKNPSSCSQTASTADSTGARVSRNGKRSGCTRPSAKLQSVNVSALASERP